MNLPEMFYQAITGIIPGDLAITGVLLFVGIAILIFKSRIPQAMAYMVGLIGLYALWLGVGQPYDAIMMAAFGVGGILFILMIFSMTRK